MVRSWQRGPFPVISVFLFAFSFLFSFGPPIGSYRPAAITTPLLSLLPLYLLSIRSGFVDTSVHLQAPTTPESHGISCHVKLDSTQWFPWLGFRLQICCCSGHR
uniref:Uncharacterized protein n=1 Tax=Fagus sylvatica TaxID=28930 RepID=A0A2N9GXE6_FAGSY